MPSVVACPSCGRNLKVPDELLGKEVRCADCAGTFLAERPRLSPPPAPVSARNRDRDRDHDYDDRPVRRGRRRSSDWEAHRGGLILAFGIISLVSTMVVPILGLPFGVLAWIWGAKDLRRIDAGTMDPDGRSTTQVGYILGIIGTIMHTLGLIVACLYIVVFVFILGFLGVAASTAVPKTAPSSAPPVRPANQPKRKVEFVLPLQLRLVDYTPQRIR